MRHTILPFLAVCLATAIASPYPLIHPSEPTPHNPFPSLTIHGVDQVGTALTNATTTALHRGKDILSKYSETLRIFAIPTGLAVSFFGYFLLTPVLFLAAFVSGGGACFVAVSTIFGEDTPAAVWISIAAMLLGGALLGFLALHALNFGMFAVGAALGVILASALKTTLIAQAYPKDPKVAFIVAAVCIGLVFGLLAVYLQKQMLIFSTAYAGSCACMFGIGSVAGHFPTTEDLSKVEAGDVDGWVVLYIALTLAVGTLGMIFQFWLARGKEMPQHAPHDRRRRRRRLRQFQFDDLSDDDDWADDVYIERVPLPRRKREPSQVRKSSSAERPVVHERAHNAERQRSNMTVSQNSWESVMKAPDAFGTPVPKDDPNPSIEMAKAHSSVQNFEDEKIQATTRDSDRPVQRIPQVPRSGLIKPAPELFDLSDTPEPTDVRQLGEKQGRLEQVPLESDGETLARV